MGEVPVHWNVRSLKSIVSTPITDGPHETPVFLDEGVPFVSAEAVSGGFINFDKIRGHISIEDNKRYSLKYKPELHDVYIVKSGATTGVSAIVDGRTDFNIWSPLAAIRCDRQCAVPQFVHFFVQSRNFQEAVSLHWRFGTQQNIGMGVLGDLPVAIPPIPEQTNIAAFLERETVKIDALVAEQEKLIALLKEKRQALISHAVTKGLDSNVPMKDSGIEWLGQVPVHWTVTPLKWLVDPDRPIMYGIVLPGPDVGEGIPILKGGNVKPARMNLNEMARTTSEIEAPYARARLKAGDLVYSIRGSIGDCEIVPKELEGSNITQDVARVAVAEGTSAPWVRWALLSTPVREELASGSLGAAVRGVNIFDLKRADLPAPSADEQFQIAHFLDEETGKIDRLIHEAEHATDLLQERRSALISAAVTGKIDVCAKVHSDPHIRSNCG